MTKVREQAHKRTRELAVIHAQCDQRIIAFWGELLKLSIWDRCEVGVMLKKKQVKILYNYSNLRLSKAMIIKVSIQQKLLWLYIERKTQISTFEYNFCLFVFNRTSLKLLNGIPCNPHRWTVYNWEHTICFVSLKLDIRNNNLSFKDIYKDHTKR